ncbi:MAG TPA: GAF domain-containing protein, partial [Deltaproteobacteria bacterium]|nr:GAF domain-containing protein [Deltaproteobacteria bacterium]
TIALGQGDLDRTVRISGSDELTQLANYFNNMAAELKEVTLRLREKTRSLERQNALLERHITERKRAEDQVHRQSAVLQGIHKVFKKSLASTTDEEIANQCLSVAEQLSGSKLGFVGELNRKGRLDNIALTYADWETCSMPQSQAERLIRNMELSGLLGRVLKEEQALIVNDPSSLPDSVGTPDDYPPLTSFLGIPLTHGGKTIGMIGLANKEAAYDLDDQEAVKAVANAFVEALLRKRAERSLRRERDFAESLIETAQAIVLVLDTRGRILRFNSYMEELSGYRLDEVQGKDWFTTFLPESDWNSIRKLFAQAVSGIQTRGNVNPIIAKDGRRYEIEWYDKTLRQTDGTVVGVLSIGQDITERSMLQSQLTQAQKLESIGQLAAGIAHEINTPTQFIGDNIRFLKDAFTDLCASLAKYAQLHEVIRSEALKPELVAEVDAVVAEADVEYLMEEISNAIDQSLDGVDRVATIVRSMKEFSHPDGEGKEPADLNTAIESTITVARNEWKYVAEMVTDFDPSLPLVPCLLGDFNQVILNMIINAAHAIRDAVGDNTGKKGTITLTTRGDDGWAEIRISDTGTGIPEEIRAKIFDPFFTTKEVGKGTGQGLAIAHTVMVKKHGGRIDVESEVDRGTTLIIRLPLSGS